MCFSATASFASTALLVPLGISALWRSWRNGRTDLGPLALMPVGFGLQQAMEGALWLELRRGPLEPEPHGAALAYLFFALALWPIWIPTVALSLAVAGPPCWRVGRQRRRLLQALQALGVLLGVGLWLPLLLQPARVDPTVVQGSIDYGLTLLLSGEMAGSVRYLYAGLISVPLLLLPSGRLRAFGLALVASGLIADWAYHHVFLSVWCYLSALLSLLVVGLVWSEPADSRRPSS